MTSTERAAGAPARRVLASGAVISSAIAAGLWMGAYVTYWQEFRGGDAYEYADIARNVLQGRGYVSRSIWLNDLTVGRPPYEYPLHRSPLAALYLVPSMAVWETHPLGVLFPSLVLYMGLTAAVWWVGARWLGVLGGICAVVLFLLNYNVLLFALSGLPTMLFAAIVTAVFVLLASSPERLSSAALAGALVGLGYLTRPNMAFIAAGVALLVALTFRRGLRTVLLMAGVAAVVVAPSLLANVRETGSPLGSSQKFILLFNTRSFPGAAVYDEVDPPEPVTFFRRRPEQLTDKVAYYARTAPRTVWTAFRWAGVGLGVTGLILAGGDPRTRRLRGLFLAGLGGQAVCDVLTHNNARFLIPFVPVLSLLGGLGLARVLSALWRRRRAAALAAGLLVAGALVWGWRGFPEVLRAEFGASEDRLLARMVRDEVSDRDELVAAVPHAAITWYADQRTIRLSARPEKMLAAERRIGPIHWLLVSGESFDRWTRALATGPELAGRYELVRRVRSDGTTTAALYRRKESDQAIGAFRENPDGHGEKFRRGSPHVTGFSVTPL